MPAGRPSDYDPSYCERIVEHMADGASVASFAAEIDISRATINVWMEKHPEFKEAVMRAKAKAASWWEQRARTICAEGGTSAQATLAIFGMKNMGGDDWRDVKSTELTGKDGGPVETATRVDVSGLDDETLRKLSSLTAKK
jgi:hypothetical protein